MKDIVTFVELLVTNGTDDEIDGTDGAPAHADINNG